MDKIWYIKINENKEGPFSLKQLKRDPRITPDTLVWKEGFTIWVPIRQVTELKDVFKEDDEPTVSESENGTANGKLGAVEPSDEMTLALREDPPYFFFWLLMAVIIVSYVLYQFYWLR